MWLKGQSWATKLSGSSSTRFQACLGLGPFVPFRILHGSACPSTGLWKQRDTYLAS